MPSDLQIETSRQNGAKSKGPVSEEGKARSARNATRHGLASRTIVLANESQDLYDQLLAAYRAEWQPQGQTENDLVVEMANAQWRMRRIWAIETASIDAEMAINRKSVEAGFATMYPALRQADAFQSLAIEDNNFLDKLHRYETRYTRAFVRAARNLVHFQRLRGFDNPAAETAAARPLSEPDPLPKLPDLQNEPGADGLLQKVMLWLMALVSYFARSAANRPSAVRSSRPSFPRNHTAPPFQAAENCREPEIFDWEIEVVENAEGA